MFTLAILIGVYSYSIFALGLAGVLYKENIFWLTIIFLFLIITHYRQKIQNSLDSYIRKIKPVKSKIVLTFLTLIIFQAFVNLVGALGPELGFDALWYHLTLPKIYLQNHQLLHIPGSLLYFSDMPKLTEMIYTSSVSLGNEIVAKLVHFIFGILSLIVLYKLSREFFDKKLSILAVTVFYANLVVSWQSTTAYVDLARTFFEILALWAFIKWIKEKKLKWLIESAVMVGFAISTKLLSLGSLIIFLILIIFNYVKDKDSFGTTVKNLVLFYLTALVIASPWVLFSFIHTQNPIYPIFSNVYPVHVGQQLLNPLGFVQELWKIFTVSADPISPVYLIFFPFLFFYFKKLDPKMKIVVYYSLISLIVWYFIPREGGGRFLMPYLPAFSIIVAAIIWQVKNQKIKTLSIGIIIFVSLISILYRGVANSKYIPVVLGKETKDEFLTNNLNFDFGDFYDVDGYFKNYIRATDRVLLYGFHNLYYVNFPFVDSSYVKKGDEFNFIATQNITLPSRFKFWKLVYSNSKTHVNLYSLGGQKWMY